MDVPCIVTSPLRDIEDVSTDRSQKNTENEGRYWKPCGLSIEFFTMVIDSGKVSYGLLPDTRPAGS